jgi:hypothetical protein
MKHSRILLMIVSFLLAASVTSSASAGVLPSLASGKLKERFGILSQRHTNRCDLTPSELASMPATARLQGSCCGPMKYSDYVKQIKGLKAYVVTDTIPPDPYDVSVALARHLIYLDRRLTLTPAEQRVYKQATRMSEEHGPCCCRCWRWFAFRGQAKQFIRLRRYSAAQIAQIWDLEDGCGSGSMMMR